MATEVWRTLKVGDEVQIADTGIGRSEAKEIGLPVGSKGRIVEFTVKPCEYARVQFEESALCPLLHPEALVPAES